MTRKQFFAAIAGAFTAPKPCVSNQQAADAAARVLERTTGMRILCNFNRSGLNIGEHTIPWDRLQQVRAITMQMGDNDSWCEWASGGDSSVNWPITGLESCHGLVAQEVA